MTGPQGTERALRGFALGRKPTAEKPCRKIVEPNQSLTRNADGNFGLGSTQSAVSISTKKLEDRRRSNREAVCRAIGEALQLFTPEECANYLANSGYRRT